MRIIFLFLLSFLLQLEMVKAPTLHALQARLGHQHPTAHAIVINPNGNQLSPQRPPNAASFSSQLQENSITSTYRKPLLQPVNAIGNKVNGHGNGGGGSFHWESPAGNRGVKVTQNALIQKLVEKFAERYTNPKLNATIVPTASDWRIFAQVADYLLTLKRDAMETKYTQIDIESENSDLLGMAVELVCILHEADSIVQHQDFLCHLEELLEMQKQLESEFNGTELVDYQLELLLKYFGFKKIEDTILGMLLNDEKTEDIIRTHPRQDMFKADNFVRLLQRSGNNMQEIEQRITLARELIPRAREVKEKCDNFDGWRWKSISNYHEQGKEDLPTEVLKKCEKRKNDDIFGHEN